MSNIAIQGAATGTGVFTLESPATNTDRTLVLPDEAGTVLTSSSSLSAGNLTGDVSASQITTALNATGSAPIYACRAWVNFNGQGTVAIRASGNVSSITDHGAGDYTVNFANAMPDTNYAVVAGSRNIASNSSVSNNIEVVTPTTMASRMYHLEAGVNTDTPTIHLVFFR